MKIRHARNIGRVLVWLVGNPPTFLGVISDYFFNDTKYKIFGIVFLGGPLGC